MVSVDDHGLANNPGEIKQEHRRKDSAPIIRRKKCPAFSVCPLKTVIGDYMEEQKEQTKQRADNDEK